jgi:hypothetical protein
VSPPRLDLEGVAFRHGSRALIRHLLAAPIALMLWGTTSVCAGAPPENACGADTSAAERLRSAGDLSGARARLTACLSAGCPSELQQCARRLAEIDAQMPTIVVEARDEANDYVTDARVTMDGAPWLERLEGKEIAVNPGEHRLTLDAPGFRRADITFEASEQQKRLRVVVSLISARGSAPASPLASPSAVPSRGPAERSLGTGRKVGLALGAVSLGGLAVGTIFSILSKSTYDHALGSECGGDSNRCSPDGIADGRTAHHQAAVATVGFATAAVFLAAGAAVYFTSSEHGSVAVTPAVGASTQGLTMVGKW